MELANKTEDVSYSIYLENKLKDKKIPPLTHALPRRNHSWVDDNSVTSCYNCQRNFSLILRRHHCRHCGKIFCYDCSNYWQMMPENMLSDDSKKGTWNEYIASYIVSKQDKKHRVCITCNDLIETIVSVKKLIDVFNIINLDVRQLKKIGQVCRLWHSASNYCLSIFREIQYKLPTDDFNEQERKLLFLNSQYLVGHSKYLVALLKVCKTEEEIGKVAEIISRVRAVKCRSLMCTRNCKNTLSSTDSIDLLSYCFRKFKNTDLLKRIALKHMVCSDREFKCYIPFMAYNIRYDDGLMCDWLINRCINNFELLSSLHWEINLYSKGNQKDRSYKNMIGKLKKVFSNKQYEQKFVKLLQQASFVKIVENIANDIFEDKKKYDDIKDKYDLKSPITIPLKPSKKIRRLLLNKIQIKNSISRPMILPCETVDGSVIRMMYKKEDVRKDQIILDLINLMEILVKEEEGIDLYIVDYNIFPIGDTTGLIEIVDDADTLYFIKEKINSNILNYIMEKNGDLKIKDLRDKFIKSTAAYCVLTYLLGVGDRHLDNIMVTKDGRLFHVDYGYVLGKDPIFWNPSIRITPEIVEAIGGFQSENYVYFKDICTKIFNCMRRNINLFMDIVLLIPKISEMNITENEIKKQIVKRFMPGENELDAQLYFVKNLEHNQITMKIKDFCHYHSKEKTISSALNRFASAISMLWSPKVEIDDEKNKDEIEVE